MVCPFLLPRSGHRLGSLFFVEVFVPEVHVWLVSNNLGRRGEWSVNTIVKKMKRLKSGFEDLVSYNRGPQSYLSVQKKSRIPSHT